MAKPPRSLPPAVADGDLDSLLQAIADLVDLKSPHLAGHSRGVANLAAAAARAAGLSDRATTLLRRAGYLHDLGRLGVSNTIWEKTGQLSHAESERVRPHPYLTDRMLADVPGLTAARQIAARHHERLDGSGYPHGLTAATLTVEDRLLAAADVYHALTESRPHRPRTRARRVHRRTSGRGPSRPPRRRCRGRRPDRRRTPRPQPPGLSSRPDRT